MQETMTSIIFVEIVRIVRRNVTGYAFEHLCEWGGIIFLVFCKIRDVRIRIAVSTYLGDLFFAHYGGEPALLAIAWSVIVCFHQYLGWPYTRYFLLDRKWWFSGMEFSDGKFAGGDIDIGDTNGITASDNACKKVVAFGCKHCGIDNGPWCDNTHNFTVDQTF